MSKEQINTAAKWIQSARRVAAFTGAGISVESGIPPFRGPDGLWSKYDPSYLEIDYFLRNPEKSWQIIKEIFYDFFGKAEPNQAHYTLAAMEQAGLLQTIITQNIDNLHQRAGSRNVYEYHGTSGELICLACGGIIQPEKIDLDKLPPKCPICGGLLKPNFIFFGEPIPEQAAQQAVYEAHHADVFIVVGSTGEIMPASLVPTMAKEYGSKIIEVNVEPSNYTRTVTDLFLQGKAAQVFTDLGAALGLTETIARLKQNNPSQT